MSEPTAKAVEDEVAALHTVASAVDHRTVVGRHRRANTRARIVEAATLVYAEKGPDTPVIDDFVKAAGMSRGTFYNHFTTTSELLEATVDWFETRLIRTIVVAAERQVDPVAQTAMAMRLYLHWITSDPTLCAFFARMPEVANVGRQAACVRLRRSVDSGALHADNFEAACDLVFGTLSETIRRIASAPTQPKRCNEVVRVLLQCLGVPEAGIEAVMALPLPDIPTPLRLNDLPAGPKLSGR